MKMIVSEAEADNLTMQLIVVCDFTEMCASLSLRSVIALNIQLFNTSRWLVVRFKSHSIDGATLQHARAAAEAWLAGYRCKENGGGWIEDKWTDTQINKLSVPRYYTANMSQ